MRDFFVTELNQMASRLAGAELLVDKDRGTFESEIRINGYQGDISTDILEIAQVHFPRQVNEDATHLVCAKFVDGSTYVFGALFADAAEHEAQPEFLTCLLTVYHDL